MPQSPLETLEATIAERKLEAERIRADAEAELDNLKLQIQELRKKLRAAQVQFQEYEAGALLIREADIAREEDLQKREVALAAQQRSLTNERQNLTTEKQQFYATRRLQ